MRMLSSLSVISCLLAYFFLLYTIIKFWKTARFYKLFLPLSLIGITNVICAVLKDSNAVNKISAYSYVSFVILEFFVLLYCISKINTHPKVSLLTRYLSFVVLFTLTALFMFNRKFLPTHAFQFYTIESTLMIPLALHTLARFLSSDESRLKLNSDVFYVSSAILFLFTFIYPMLAISTLERSNAETISMDIQRFIAFAAYSIFFYLISKAIQCRSKQA